MQKYHNNKYEFGIILGFSCNSKCSHCLINSNQEVPISLSEESIDNVVNNYKYIAKSTSQIIFTGGEPILYLDNIQTILTKLKNYIKKTPVKLITNGYFANSINSCTILEKFPKLDEVVLSYDEYHTKYSATNYIFNLQKYFIK